MSSMCDDVIDVPFPFQGTGEGEGEGGFVWNGRVGARKKEGVN